MNVLKSQSVNDYASEHLTNFLYLGKQRIEEFGEVVGLKINREKTKVIFKNLTQKQKEQLSEKVDF